MRTRTPSSLEAETFQRQLGADVPRRCGIHRSNAV